MPPDFRMRMAWRIQQRHLGARSILLVGVHAHGIVREGNARLERCHLLRHTYFCRTISDGALDGIAALEVVIEYRVVEGATNKVRRLRDAVYPGSAGGCDGGQCARGPLRQVVRYDSQQAL